MFVSLPGLFQLFLSISHLYASLGEKKSLLRSFARFFNQVTWEGLLLSCMNSLYILGIRLSSNTCLPSIFSPSIYCFSFCSWFPLLYGTFYLMQLHLFLVLLSALLVSYPKPMPRSIAKSFFLSLCFLSEVLQFQVLQLSVSSVLSSFSWTWQKVAVQYSQHHLIKRLLFAHCIFSAA